mmetsp:Transcript_8371/g.19811  ORF Transcript_8371/g.19811 Transcript_8371/m.19811 type:complete len:939 (+) Transcript_8371:138-2954(+)
MRSLLHLRTNLNGIGALHKIWKLIKVQVSVGVSSGAIDALHVISVLIGGGKTSQDAGHGGQLSTGEVYVGTLAETVGEVTGRRTDDRGLGSHAGLVAHAKRAAGHLRAGSGGAKDRVVSLRGQLGFVHLGGRADPKAGGDGRTELLQELAGRTEMSNVGHARADEHLVNVLAGDIGQRGTGIRIVGEGKDGLRDVGQVDIDDGGVVGTGIGLQKDGVGEPLVHPGDATLEGAGIAVSLGNHPLEHHHIGLQVLLDGILVELDGTSGSTALGTGIGQLEGLLALELGKALNLQNLAREDILFALLRHGQQSHLLGSVGDGLNQITEGHTGLHLTGKANQDRLGHVQGHHAGGTGKRHEARSGGERNADGEPGVRIASGTDRVGNQHAVQPRVDDAVAGAEADAAARPDEVGQGVVRHHVDGLGIRGRVAEALHDQVGREAQAGQGLELVARHGPGGVLRPDGGHGGFAVLAGDDTRDAAGLSDHLLREGVSRGGPVGLVGKAEGVGDAGVAAQGDAGLAGQAAADDEGDPPPGPDLVEDDGRLEPEGAQDGVGAGLGHPSLAGVDVDDVAGVQARDVHLEGEGAGVLHGVEEDGRDLVADADAAGLDVGNVGDVLPHEPKEGVGGGLARRAGADDVADVGEGVALGLEVGDLLEGADLALLLGVDAVAGVLEHGHGVERDVGPGPGVLGRAEVVGVGLTGDLEHRDGDLVGHLRLAGVPLGSGPALQHLGRHRVAPPVQFLHVVEGIEDQQGALELLSGQCGDGGVRIGQEGDEGGHVVPALHGAEEFDGAGTGDEGGCFVAQGQGGQVRGLGIGGLVDSRGDAVGKEVDEPVCPIISVFRRPHLLNKLGHLGRAQGLRRDAQPVGQRRALGHVLVVRGQEGRQVPELSASAEGCCWRSEGGGDLEAGSPEGGDGRRGGEGGGEGRGGGGAGQDGGGAD